MQSMSVRPESVTQLSGEIRRGAGGIRTELDKLESEVTKLRGSWSGAAQQAYDEAQRKWTRSLTELQQLLEQIATKTQEMSHEYVSRDNSSAKRFQ
ncbi:WXG100 family type VII secretion target [Microbacterium sp. 22242]|uniref:WXG100 family type VII secretion target n=1 Tax=Microbacterium sp. 22242 TaxID=3453896 RepID=UPI003F8425EB